MVRMTNTFLERGAEDPEAIIAGTEYGVYCVALGGGQVDPATGDFVFGMTEAYLVEGGVTGSVDIITRKPLEFRQQLTVEGQAGGVYAEKPGTTDWQLTYVKFDAKAKYRQSLIEGYCTRTSATFTATPGTVTPFSPAATTSTDAPVFVSTKDVGRFSPMYHGAGWRTTLARLAMCWREMSSTSPSNVY